MALDAIKVKDSVPEDPEKDFSSVTAAELEDGGNLKDKSATLYAVEYKVDGITEFRFVKAKAKAAPVIEE